MLSYQLNRWTFHQKEVTVFESFAEFFDCLINGQFGFAEIGEWFAYLWASFFELEIGVMVNDLLANAGIIATAVLLVLSLLQLFVGKKLLGFQKFILFLFVGFTCGALYLAPVVEGFGLPVLVPGIVVGVIAALLCKPLYVISYIFTAAASIFSLCYSGAILPDITEGNLIIGAAAAVVAVVLALVLRKVIEFVGTSFLGALCAYLCIDTLIGGFDAMLGDAVAIVKWVIIGVLALVGLIVQVKTRRRY